MQPRRPRLTATWPRTVWPALLAAALATGCASMDSLTADVATFGEWPAGRGAASYAFDRLPSQQAAGEATQQAARQADRLEAAARGALERAGFKPVAAGQSPDVLVQLGARLTRTDPVPWADGLWWRGALPPWPGAWRGAWMPPLPPLGPGIAPAWAWHVRAEPRRYEREVALLIRERASGKPLYEARASVETFTRGDDATIAALFAAALQGFPKVESQPKAVTVSLPR